MHLGSLTRRPPPGLVALWSPPLAMQGPGRDRTQVAVAARPPSPGRITEAPEPSLGPNSNTKLGTVRVQVELGASTDAPSPPQCSDLWSTPVPWGKRSDCTFGGSAGCDQGTICTLLTTINLSAHWVEQCGRCAHTHSCHLSFLPRASGGVQHEHVRFRWESSH